MRGVFFRATRTAAAWLLIVVLLAPSALATDVASNASLWAEFVAWLEAQLGTPDVPTSPDEASFEVWLMARPHIPGG